MDKPSYDAARLAHEILNGSYSAGRTDRIALEQAIAIALDKTWAAGARETAKATAKKLELALQARHSATAITALIAELKAKGGQ